MGKTKLQMRQMGPMKIVTLSAGLVVFAAPLMVQAAQQKIDRNS